MAFEDNDWETKHIGVVKVWYVYFKNDLYCLALLSLIFLLGEKKAFP